MGQKILQISPTDISLVRFRTRWPTSPSPTGAERQSLWLRRRCLDSCEPSSSSKFSLSDLIWSHRDQTWSLCDLTWSQPDQWSHSGQRSNPIALDPSLTSRDPYHHNHHLVSNLHTVSNMISPRYIRQTYGPSKPLKGARIAGCLHMTVQVIITIFIWLFNPPPPSCSLTAYWDSDWVWL